MCVCVEKGVRTAGELTKHKTRNTMESGNGKQLLQVTHTTHPKIVLLLLLFLFLFKPFTTGTCHTHTHRYENTHTNRQCTAHAAGNTQAIYEYQLLFFHKLC